VVRTRKGEIVGTKALPTVAQTSAATGLGERIIRQCVADGSIPGARYGRLIRIPFWWVQRQLSGPTEDVAA
jgi:excisionase family DNA binding protein